MANRVNVNITARDLTRGQLARVRGNFNRLGQDLDRAVGNRSRQNFQRLSQSVNQARRDLNSMRGAIPDDEFYRLDDAMQRAQRRLQRGFSNVGDRAFRRIQADLQRVRDGFNDLDENGQIRVRVDLSALRRADARLDVWRRTQSARRITPRVDPDVDSRFGRRLMRTLTAPFRQSGRVLGGILSDGIGQGIVQGFQGAGPAGKAAFAAILAGTLAWLGAALGGLLITVLGAAFVTVGGIAAFQSEEIQKKWKSVLESLKKDFEEVGKPMIPVLDRALSKLEDLSGRVAPKFAEALEKATPATNSFIDKLFEGFERLGKRAFKPIMDAWDVFAPIFGDVFSDFMSDVGGHLGDMANIVREHSFEIETALRMVFGVLSGLLKVVRWLMEAWVWAMGAMGDATGALLKFAITPLVQGILEAFYQILNGAEWAFGWIPGIGDDLEKAKRSFGAWKDQVVDDLYAGAEAAFGFDEAMERLNRTRVLRADIKSWQQQLTTAKRKLKDVMGTKAEAKVRANIRDLESKIAKAKRELSSMNGRTATSYVYTVYQDRYTSLSQRQRRHGLRTGGVVGQAATGGVRNNMTLVGEDGPELVDLPGGSRVRSNPDTRRLMGGSGGTQTVQLMIDAGPSETSRLLLKLLRSAIRAEGGNVELVLGRNS
jgi:hypothetical protein